jgi:hypothetical protein
MARVIVVFDAIAAVRCHDGFPARRRQSCHESADATKTARARWATNTTLPARRRQRFHESASGAGAAGTTLATRAMMSVPDAVIASTRRRSRRSDERDVAALTAMMQRPTPSSLPRDGGRRPDDDHDVGVVHVFEAALPDAASASTRRRRRGGDCNDSDACDGLGAAALVRGNDAPHGRRGQRSHDAAFAPSRRSRRRRWTRRPRLRLRQRPHAAALVDGAARRRRR